ncbi:solute carrier family 25 member 51-like [Acanthaster planci]|uniref:Solute carrier family 25 member 51-like n=1 Tax=Acanthaster planci TaxID=133434 RepID=A0A8B7ZYW9_ACAPL|nr:solute carrier family 25 member 51-like [Acanthaster planci]XP_022110291.1 solute carrier family 25 member 51-like [Acanthaster planci]XP_022110292.1 solute carrier family 25 member 51-like [Acanthaster planci]
MGNDSHNVQLSECQQDSLTRAPFTNGSLYFPVLQNHDTYGSGNQLLTKDITYKPDWVEFTAGAGAAFINIILTFPINKIIFRQQLHSIKVHKALRQLKREGTRHLYRGVLPPLLQRMSALSLMFGLYDQYSRIIIRYCSDCPLIVAKVTAALLSGTTEAILVPFERVQTVLQDHRHMKNYTNTFQVFHRLRIYGFREYYRGLTPILLRNGPSNAVFFTMRDQLQMFTPKDASKVQKVAHDFVSGAFLGASLSTIWFPVNVIKTKMQSKVGGEFESAWRTFYIVYNERGRRWRAMFRGVHLNFSRALVSWGIINASYGLLVSTLREKSS